MAKPRKNPVRKKNVRKAMGPRKSPLIEVVNEGGRVIYKGRDRRSHAEQVFFDSRNKARRFVPSRSGISQRRRKQLSKIGKKEALLGKTTYPSQRNPKHREKKL